VSLNHDRRGAGDPLVLVHGIGSQWPVWSPILDRLAAERDVVSVDLPGFGGTPPDGTTPSVEGFAGRLERFFAELGLDRPHVAGNSLGGGIALELARRGTVRSATALSPIGFWTPKERAFCQSSLRRGRAASRALASLIPAAMGNPVTRTLLLGQLAGRPWRMPAPDAVAAIDALVAAPGFDAALAQFSQHVFHEPGDLRDVPVTVAWGQRDALLIYARQAPRARRMLPRARHVTLTGCGHVPFHDDPDQVATVVLAGSDG
jgi:pimeloyl-ACP methyl ester carboxylesterase